MGRPGSGFRNMVIVHQQPDQVRQGVDCQFLPGVLLPGSWKIDLPIVIPGRNHFFSQRRNELRSTFGGANQVSSMNGALPLPVHSSLAL